MSLFVAVASRDYRTGLRGEMMKYAHGLSMRHSGRFSASQFNLKSIIRFSQTYVKSRDSHVVDEEPKPSFATTW